MAVDFPLAQDEGVILDDGGKLVLTHKRLVRVERTLFGKVKGLQEMPLAMIKVVNDEAQVFVRRRLNSDWCDIEVHMSDGSGFEYAFDSAANARTWVDAISNLVVGHPSAQAAEDAQSLRGAIENFTSSAKDAVGALASSFGLSSGSSRRQQPLQPATKQGQAAVSVQAKPEHVSTRCRGCHASLSGMSGQRVTCPYCDTEQVL